MMKLVELLEDYEWHRVEDIHRKAGAIIPPGQAIRRQEQSRLANGGPPVRVKALSEERQIESGRRLKVSETLYSMDVEFDPPGGRGPDRRVRLRSLPPKVVTTRELEAEGRRFDADQVLDAMLDSHDPEVVIAHLTPINLRKLALRAAERLQAQG